MTEVKTLMDELSSVEGVLGAGVISKDGKAVEMRIPDKLSHETISIMAATVYGAACTLHSEAKKNMPGRITIKTEDCETHIYDIGKRALVTVITCEGFDTAAVDPILSNLCQVFG
jgi:predicted regulator of Ras-like GTPase activity (Roadblock/LC7/MglB family)